MAIKVIKGLGKAYEAFKKTGVIGDKVKMGDVDFKQFKKIINKTPNKEFKQTTIGGKAQKKKIIDQETSIKRKMDAKKEEYKSPITSNDD